MVSLPANLVHVQVQPDDQVTVLRPRRLRRAPPFRGGPPPVLHRPGLTRCDVSRCGQVLGFAWQEGQAISPPKEGTDCSGGPCWRYGRPWPSRPGSIERLANLETGR